MADSFGELLRQFRIAASLTQEALAERCRISPATIAAIEQGRRNAPRLSTVRLIADALGLPAADRETLARAADRAAPARAAAGGRTGAGRRMSPQGPPGTDPGADPELAGSQPGPGQVIGMPTAWTSFIGRGREQAVVLDALADSRMVTLVGPGGVGKTRLAAQVTSAAAERHGVGAVFVDLVPVREEFVSQAVAALVGVAEGPGRSLDAALHEFFASGRWLLVLDNCEHLLTVVAGFAEKLRADCADLTILATSRERLAIPGEHAVAVPPLSLAGGSDPASGSDAEALFIDRAATTHPGFRAARAAVSEVCSRLDGMPLAIELAAARCASLGMDGLLAGLDDHLRLLAGSRRAQSRHRSLRAVIDWSHDLLEPDERMMFRRAGAFSGAFDLDAAVRVSAIGSRGVVADLLGRLADKSLLTLRQGTDGSRWQMLETIRAYAAGKLAESGEAAAILDAHLGWAADVAGQLEAQVRAGLPWRGSFDAVADDLRAAAARAPGQEARATSHRLARSLGHLAYARRFMVEARDHYRAAAARAGEPAQAASDLDAAACVAMAEGHGATAFGLLVDAARQAEAGHDDRARAVALARAVTIADRFAAQFAEEVPHARLRLLLDEAARACPPGDLVAAACVAASAAWIAQPEKTVPDEALSRDALDAARLTGDPILISGALDAVVGALDAGGRLREAHRVNQERGALLGQLPRHEPRAGAEIVDTYHMLTEIAVTAGDLPDALVAARLAEDDDIARGQPHMTACKPVLPLVLQGRFDEALRHATRMWESWNHAGQPAARWMGPAMYGIVLAHGLRGDREGHRDWLERIDELIGSRRAHVSETNLDAAASFTAARIALHEGRIGDASAATADLPVETRSWYQMPHWYSLRPYAWAIAAEVAVAAGLPDAASRLAVAAPAGDENHWAAACLARAAGRLSGDRDALARSITGWERIDARFERACTLLLLSDRADEGMAELRALGCRPPAAWRSGVV